MALKKNVLNPILTPIAMATQNAMKQSVQQPTPQTPIAPKTPVVKTPADQYAMGGYGSQGEYGE